MFDGVETTKGLSSSALICNVLIKSQGRIGSFLLSLSIKMVEAGQWSNMQLIKVPTHSLSALSEDIIKVEFWVLSTKKHSEAQYGAYEVAVGWLQWRTILPTGSLRSCSLVSTPWSITHGGDGGGLVAIVELEGIEDGERSRSPFRNLWLYGDARGL